jgi:hypothetical protein
MEISKKINHLQLKVAHVPKEINSTTNKLNNLKLPLKSKSISNDSKKMEIFPKKYTSIF